MQITIKSENKESIYELFYDEESLKILISEIIRKCSIRKECCSTVRASSKKDAICKIESATNFNDDRIYENICDVAQMPINDPFDYWRPGDPVDFSFKSNVLFSPKLVDFLIDVIKGNYINYEWFVNKEELDEINSIEDKISKLNLEINKISNFETERKISKLKELSRLVDIRDSIPKFDYELLSKFYDIAQSCIQLELVEEKIIFQKKLTPKGERRDGVDLKRMLEELS